MKPGQGQTWRATCQDPTKALPSLPAVQDSPTGRVEVGQVWASADSRDRRNGWRQERLVTRVRTMNPEGYQRYPIAYLYSMPGQPHQATSACGIEGSRILRHYYVREATPDELSAHAAKMPAPEVYDETDEVYE